MPSINDFESVGRASSDLRLKQVEHLYANTVRAPAINILNGVVLAILLWPVTPHAYVLSWCVLLLVLNVTRLGLGWLYQRYRHLRIESHYWIRLYVIAAILSGVAWGLAALLMPPDRFEYQVLVMLMVGGMVLGGLPMLAVTKAAFSIYLFVAVVPISVKMFTMGGFVSVLIGALILLFMFTTYVIGKDLYKTFTSALLSRVSVEKMARRDPLTNIANRRWFDEYLEQVWRYAVRGSFPLSMVIVDIDNFKQYNDHYGHTKGDECLMKVADALRLSLPRKTDLLARYGGEEFVSLLPFTDANGGVLVAERLRSAVSTLAINHAPSVAIQNVTISVGGATCLPKPDITSINLVNVADQALYEAKAVGKNRCIWKSSGST
jgi:diguanylate cyclase (GGDEF)-like protein